MKRMTPWFFEHFHRYCRMIRLGFHVAKNFFNPFGDRFLDSLAFELWYLIAHEQEASARMDAMMTNGPVRNDMSFADDLMLSDSPDMVDDELEACLAEAEGHVNGRDVSGPPKVSLIDYIFISF